MYAGIDNSSFDHKVRIIDQNGNVKSSFTISNSYGGFCELERSLIEYQDVQIGFELPHGPLIDFLHVRDQHLYSLNPLKVKRFKESVVVSGDKSDMIDALAIAEYLRKNSSYVKEMFFNSPEIEKLSLLSKIHGRATKEHARLLNKLHFAVRQYFPLMEGLFSSFGLIIQVKKNILQVSYIFSSKKNKLKSKL